jgi:acyl-coenzyme A thioesterase PaaI-like protein
MRQALPWKKRLLFRALRIWPPYAGAGIRVTRHSGDRLSWFEVEMKLRWWNRNYVGTHFGGSLYSMADPFFMLILMEGLGAEYVVWDKAATIRFRKPGRGTVRARFEIAEEKIAAIREAADRDEKVEPQFITEIRDEEGELVAEVEKLLYVRRKKSG